MITLRETHIGALKRFCAELKDPDRRAALSAAQLRMRATRLQKHFDDFEGVHLLLQQTSRLTGNRIYENMERRFMKAMETIDVRLQQLKREELSRIGQGSIGHGSIGMVGFARGMPSANSTMLHQG